MIAKIRKRSAFDSASALSAPGQLETKSTHRSTAKTSVKSYSVRNDLLEKLETLRVKRGERSTSKLVNEALEAYLKNVM